MQLSVLMSISSGATKIDPDTLTEKDLLRLAGHNNINPSFEDPGTPPETSSNEAEDEDNPRTSFGYTVLELDGQS